MDFCVGLAIGLVIMFPGLLYNYCRRVEVESQAEDRCKQCQVDKAAIRSMQNRGV